MSDQDLADEAIVKVDETPDEALCGFCAIVTGRCRGGCCEACDCPDPD